MLDELKKKAEGLMNDENVKNVVDKAKDFVNSEKGKEALESAKEKVEGLVAEKTDGKGIFGFGKK